MSLIIQTLKGGFDKNFSYIIGCDQTKELAIVDMSIDWDTVHNALLKLGSRGFTRIHKILLTHVHFDHITSLPDIVEFYNSDIEVYAHPSAKKELLRQTDIEPTHYVRDNDVIDFGELKIKVIHTPGHQEECICFQVDDKIFTGDTLFVGACGRVDLPGSDPQKQFQSMEMFATQISDDLEVLPGHDYGSTPTSTIAHEKLTNPYLQPFMNKEFNEHQKFSAWIDRRSNKSG